MTHPLTTTEFDLDRVVELKGRSQHVWYRRIVLLAMFAFICAALAEAFGQGAHTTTRTGPAGTLTVHIPSTVRGGLLVPVQIKVSAREKIAAPQVVLGPGFLKGMQVNTLEPSATSETTRRAPGGQLGSLALTYPTLNAGDQLTVFLQLQIDPTTVGKQDASVSIEGANVAPIRVPGSITVLP